MEGLHLRPQPLGLGVARFLLPLPSAIQHLFLLIYFLFLLYVNI
jgi:hypothetical protein